MTKPVICIGAALVDELFHTRDPILEATTNNATVTRTAGGVARNIAHHLALLGVPVQLISVFGEDADGEWLKGVCHKAGVRLDGALTVQEQTGRYTGILTPEGSLYTAFLSNPATHKITPEHLESRRDLLETASYILADANLERETIAWLLSFSKTASIPFIIEPVSVPPASKLAQMDLQGLYLITPNEDELPAICSTHAKSLTQQINELLNRGVQQVWLHNGARGSTLFSRSKQVSLHACAIEVADCTGAGDGSLTGFLLGKHLGREDEACLRIAHTLAAEILKVKGAIAYHLDREKLQQLVPVYYPG